jgi:hypothetical protein
MASHVRTLGILHIVFGGLGLLGALGLLVFTAGFLGLATRDPSGDMVATHVMGGLGAVAALFLAIVSLPGLIGGIGLLNLAPWSRILMIVISALELLSIPFGTALGIYGLWVLTKPETQTLLSRRTV